MRLFRRDRPLSCKQVGKLVQRYLDGELDDERCTRIAEHLDACRRCGLEADTYLRIKATLAARGLGRAPEPTGEQVAASAPPPEDPALERLRAFAERLAEGSADPPEGR